MLRYVAILPILLALVGIMKKTGGIDELKSFGLARNTELLGTIITNIIIVIIFAELYLILDKSGEEGEHYGFKDSLDAYYFSTVTSSSTGYGDILPKSRKAKMLNIAHLMIMFFIVVPALIKALEPGN